MNNSLRHPKRRGEWVELQFMACAAAHGLTVSKPWGDSARYDFVVERAAGLFHRVQVKSTMHQSRLRGYSSQAHRCWVSRSSRPGTQYKYSLAEVDFLVCFIIPLDLWYVLPIAEVSQQTVVTVDPGRFNNRYAKFMEAWHLLK